MPSHDRFRSNHRPPLDHNAAEFSVSELSLPSNAHLEGNFERVRCRAKFPASSAPPPAISTLMLKDENAAMKAVCWKGVAGRLGLAPEDGMEVVATGPDHLLCRERSEYQLVIERLEVAESVRC